MEKTQDLAFYFAWDLDSNQTTEFIEPQLAEKLKAENFNLELDCFDEKEQEDKLWQAKTGLNFETLCAAIETIIFMSDRPISLTKIKAYIDADLPLRVVHESITRLQAEYEQKHHGLRLQEVADGFQFRTKATYSKFVQDIFKVSSIQLSPTALEVLAVIAYKQPISKTYIDDLRGVDSSHIVRALMDKRLVKVVGRSEEIGKPSLYGTTTEFLEVFNLSGLAQLPPEYELEELASGNSVGQISDIKSIVGGDKTKFNFEEMEELDRLAESIKEIASDTIFTKVLQTEDKKNESEGERKSAFEILEEFVTREQTLTQNKSAAASNIITNTCEVRVVKPELIMQHTFNAPVNDEEFDEDMLLTANVISETQKLEQALDEAFADLRFDGAWESAEPSESDDLAQEIEAGFDELNQKLTQAIDQAHLMDLDLDFLNQNSESLE